LMDMDAGCDARPEPAVAFATNATTCDFSVTELVVLNSFTQLTPSLVIRKDFSTPP
jgi:hypothetical protein